MIRAYLISIYIVFVLTQKNKGKSDLLKCLVRTQENCLEPK